MATQLEDAPVIFIKQEEGSDKLVSTLEPRSPDNWSADCLLQNHSHTANYSAASISHSHDPTPTSVAAAKSCKSSHRSHCISSTWGGILVLWATTHYQQFSATVQNCTR